MINMITNAKYTMARYSAFLTNKDTMAAMNKLKIYDISMRSRKLIFVLLTRFIISITVAPGISKTVILVNIVRITLYTSAIEFSLIKKLIISTKGKGIAIKPIYGFFIINTNAVKSNCNTNNLQLNVN